MRHAGTQTIETERLLLRPLTPEQREQVEAILRGTEQTRTYLLKIRAQAVSYTHLEGKTGDWGEVVTR